MRKTAWKRDRRARGRHETEFSQNIYATKHLEMLYRRNEVRRKLLKEKGKASSIKSWTLDFPLKILTGYGIRGEKPFVTSAIAFISIVTYLSA